MAVLDDIDAKLDQLLSIMGEEVNIHPDSLMPGSVVHCQLSLTINMAITLTAEFRVEDREGGRYIAFRLRDGGGYCCMNRAWRAVYRDLRDPGFVVDRPGQT